MRRQRRGVEVRVRAAGGVTASQTLIRYAKGTPSEPALRMRVRDDGRLRARIAVASRYNSPPHFVGRLADGVVTGTIRESYVEVLVPRLFTGLAAFLAVVCVALLSTGDVTNPGVYVCGVGATALGSIGYLLGRQRRPSFTRHADRLEHAIRTAAG